MSKKENKLRKKEFKNIIEFKLNFEEKSSEVQINVSIYKNEWANEIEAEKEVGFILKGIDCLNITLSELKDLIPSYESIRINNLNLEDNTRTIEEIGPNYYLEKKVSYEGKERKECSEIILYKNGYIEYLYSSSNGRSMSLEYSPARYEKFDRKFSELPKEVQEADHRRRRLFAQ